MRDVIEALLVNGESVDFAHLVDDGDRISVYPVFESIDITSLLRVRARPLRRLRFVLDVHLVRLAAYLRMLGFDSADARPRDAQARRRHPRLLRARDESS